MIVRLRKEADTETPIFEIVQNSENLVPASIKKIKKGGDKNGRIQSKKI